MGTRHSARPCDRTALGPFLSDDLLEQFCEGTGDQSASHVIDTFDIAGVDDANGSHNSHDSLCMAQELQERCQFLLARLRRAEETVAAVVVALGGCRLRCLRFAAST